MLRNDKAVIKANNNSIMRFVNNFMFIFEIIITALVIIATAYLIMQNMTTNVEMKKNDADVPTEVLQMQRLYSPEVELIARMAYHEAGNQCEEGIRLVIDTVLNRVEHPEFPDDIESVLTAPKQYTCVISKDIYNGEINTDIAEMVVQEMDNRTDNEVIYFCSTGYANGTPLFKVQDHYFSKR